MVTTGKSQVDECIDSFADATMKQTDAIWNGDARTGNRHAKRRMAAFERLAAVGDFGREAMLRLLEHPRKDVRVEAAAYLLRYRTDLALSVLREESEGEGLASLGAIQTIKRWEEGDWRLDPAD